MNKTLTTLILPVILVSILACGGAPRKLALYPTPTVDPTQTPVFVVWTGTAPATYTPIVVVVTQTPQVAEMCVKATEAAYLRPAPNLDNYPVAPVSNGAKVRDLGGRDGAWAFVAFGGKKGWIKIEYLGACA